jgi:hypothetical protein
VSTWLAVSHADVFTDEGTDDASTAMLSVADAPPVPPLDEELVLLVLVLLVLVLLVLLVLVLVLVEPVEELPEVVPAVWFVALDPHATATARGRARKRRRARIGGGDQTRAPSATRILGPQRVRRGPARRARRFLTTGRAS